jgi:glutathione synthase/RimK-type ligase-like ATP-grasp enzyme
MLYILDVLKAYQSIKVKKKHKKKTKNKTKKTKQKKNKNKNKNKNKKNLDFIMRRKVQWFSIRGTAN